MAGQLGIIVRTRKKLTKCPKKISEKKPQNLKLFVFKNILGLNGVKVAAVFIGGMPGLQSVSG